jgi:hypothetical protein
MLRLCALLCRRFPINVRDRHLACSSVSDLPCNGNSIVISTAVQTMGKGTRPDWREWGKIHGGRGVGGRAAAQSITGLPFGQFGSKTGHPGAVFGGEPLAGVTAKVPV